MANVVGGSVVWNLDIDKKGLSKGLSQARSEVSDTTSDIERSTSSFSGTLKKTILGVSAAFSAAVAGFSIAGIRMSADLESATQGFTALLGSAELANATMERIKQEAKATPFELPGLVQGTQALAAITKNGDEAIDILLDVGKAVAVSGKGQAELDSVVANLQQIAATGAVTELDIRQFQRAIPIFNDIVTGAGLTTDELKNSANAAELLFDAFERAGETGISAQGFTAQAGTFNQIMSNLKDTVGIAASEFVNATGIFDTAKFALQGIGDVIPVLVGRAIDLINTIKNLDVTNNSFFGSLLNFVNTIRPFVVEFFSVVAKLVVEQGRKILNDLRPAWESLREALLPMIPIFKGIALVLSLVVGGAILVLIPLLGELLRIVIKVFTGMVQIVSGVAQTIQGVFGLIAGIIYGLVTRDFTVLRDGWNNLWQGIQRTVEGVVNALSGVLGNFVENIRRYFEDLRNKVSGPVNSIKGALENLNPFHRSSPSLVDNITKGVRVIENLYAGIRIPEYNPSGSFPDVVTNGSLAGTKAINITNNMTVRNESDFDAFSRRLSFEAQVL